MKETILLTKHMRENPEDSHSLKSYEKNGGYKTVKKVLKSGSPPVVKVTNFFPFISNFFLILSDIII